MKNKIKKTVYAIASGSLLAPALVLAYQIPSNTADLPDAPIYKIVENFMVWILGLIGFFGMIAFAIAGILYLTAAGNEDRIETAKRAMMWSIVGIIVALMGVIIIKAADAMLSASNSTF